MSIRAVGNKRLNLSDQEYEYYSQLTKVIDKNAIIKSVKKTGRIIIVEEGWRFCGVGAEIISMLVEEAFDYLDAEPIRITGKNVPLPYAENLEKKSLPQIDEIVQKSKDICYFKGKN